MEKNLTSSLLSWIIIRESQSVEFGFLPQLNGSNSILIDLEKRFLLKRLVVKTELVLIEKL